MSVRFLPPKSALFAVFVMLSLLGCSDTKAKPEDKGSDAIADVDTIAKVVADSIEGLKDEHPRLKPFWTSSHLIKGRAYDGIEPGKPGNEELYSISFHNGILGRKPMPKDGKKRSAEDIFDPKTGIRLYVHFFVGESRGADARMPQKIGNLNVHFYISGPNTDPIKADIQEVLDEIKKHYE